MSLISEGQRRLESVPRPTEGRSARLTLSVVIEWANALDQGLGRTGPMLEALMAQLRELTSRGGDDEGARLDEAVEVIVAFDDEAFELAEVEGCVRRGLPEPDAAWRLRFVSAPGSDYYQLKNLGVEASSGELILFVDCDVIPEPGWLAALLEPMADESVVVVAGETHLARSTLYERTMALAWFYPLRSADAPLQTTTRFWANNLLMRSELARRYPFPDQGEGYRASCQLLARTLLNDGIEIVRQRRARVEHPAPERFFSRALLSGRDAYWKRRDHAIACRKRSPLIDTLAHLSDRDESRRRRLRRERARVGITRVELPAAYAIASGWGLLEGVGAVVGALGGVRRSLWRDLTQRALRSHRR